MRVLRALRRGGRAALPPAVFLGLTAYFGWNATQGDRGLVATAARQQLLVQAEAERTKAEAERDRWEKRVAGLRAARIDPDALDESARAMLNLSDPADIIVPWSGKQKLF